MAEVVRELKLERDYKNYLYFLDGDGNVCRKAKAGDSSSEIVVANAVTRDNGYLYYVNNDGNVARSPRVSRGPGKKKVKV